MNRPPLRTRIAPTPSGFLHIGNLYSFVLTWLIARVNGGTVRLRIDDLDEVRTRQEYLENIFRVLDFIGLVPDEGPSGVEDFLGHHSQKLRVHNYMALINQLKDAGHLFACSCSRSRIMAENTEGIYPGTCRTRQIESATKEIAWRVALPPGCHIQFQDVITKNTNKVVLTEEMGDFAVMRKDELPAYQIASLADDLLYGINLVVRGNDLRTSTAAKLHLATLLSLSTFASMDWHHHSLLRNEQKQKISKSAGDLSVWNMMEKGMKKDDFLYRIAPWLGLPQRPYQSLDEMHLACLELGLFCIIR
jgi:glutamyl/glutaminyl-tRNA synthetase